MHPSTTIYGIRHHGPGSARSLLAALEQNKPEVILIEGPPEGDALLEFAGTPGMRPPVALLVYNPKNLHQASFFPYADFSPEWQAILFGLHNKIPLQFIDLPMGLAFPLRPEDEIATQLELVLPETILQADPFTAIGRLAGYSDPERWWEAMFERWTVDTVDNKSAFSAQRFSARNKSAFSAQRFSAGNQETEAGADPFEVVLELMQALRADKEQRGIPESRETLLREAWMRQALRRAEKTGFGKIAVVCGAWHAPALADPARIKASTDAALLKGMKKVSTRATWIPWSFDRLAHQSGYAAGVLAPAWYQVLWNTANSQDQRPVSETIPHSDKSIRLPHAVWLSKAAQVLRANDVILASSQVIEAVRLSETLAVLRNTILPGIEELREAAVTVLCEGAEKPYELIERQLVIGDVLGTVPATVPLIPLRADFDAQVRSARLKLNTDEQTLQLDLRETAHLFKSRLLYRLRLLDIPWGRPEVVGGRKEGRFHENWTLKWLPDFEIRLIEAGALGNTVEAAAAHKANRQLHKATQLPELVGLLDLVLKADLASALPALLKKLRDTSALAQDSLELAQTTLPLVEVLRYGHARQLDLVAIEQLLEQIVPRVCIQLPAACRGVNEELAGDISKQVLAVNRGIHLWRPEIYMESWQAALAQIAEQGAPLLAGIACRLLFEQKKHSAAETGQTMQFRLSHAQPTWEAAQWLEGFLHGSGLLLLHQPALWQVLNNWVGNIPEPLFPEVLPLLRRTFSRFSGPEREKMLDLARSGLTILAAHSETRPEGWDSERAALVQPLLKALLG